MRSKAIEKFCCSSDRDNILGSRPTVEASFDPKDHIRFSAGERFGDARQHDYEGARLTQALRLLRKICISPKNVTEHDGCVTTGIGRRAVVSNRCSHSRASSQRCVKINRCSLGNNQGLFSQQRDRLFSVIFFAFSLSALRRNRQRLRRSAQHRAIFQIGR